MPTFEELRRRGHSYRNFEPHEVINMMAEQGRGRGRDFFGWVESGRMEDMLDAALQFYIALDVDERKTFWRRNPDLMRWVAAWGVSEHLNPGTHNMPEDVELYPNGSAPDPSEIEW